MRVIILTQEDSFTIPKNILSISRIEGVEILMIVNINCKFSLGNNKKLFILGFGPVQSIKLGFIYFINWLLGLLEVHFGLYFTKYPHSLRSVAKKNNTRYHVISNPNDDYFLTDLTNLKPDLIVSFSAPMIFKERLLLLPKYGCINLHCSFLPYFAGVMPSFWTLFKQQKITGVTIHKMDSKIDNGLILNQREVPIVYNETIFSLISKTKHIGGDLMCDVISDIINGNVNYLSNRTEEGSYFSWPTIQDLRQFKKNGGKLI